MRYAIKKRVTDRIGYTIFSAKIAPVVTVILMTVRTRKKVETIMTKLLESRSIFKS